MPFKTLAEFKALNKSTGRHFFDPGTMEFWKSRIESDLAVGKYFLTSEMTWDDMHGGTSKRVYAVRQANEDGSVTTLQKGFSSRMEAEAFIGSKIIKDRTEETSNDKV